MRSDDRSGCNAHQIPERFVVEVGDIQYHAQFFHPFDSQFSSFGQTSRKGPVDSR